MIMLEYLLLLSFFSNAITSVIPMSEREPPINLALTKRQDGEDAGECPSPVNSKRQEVGIHPRSREWSEIMFAKCRRNLPAVHRSLQ